MGPWASGGRLDRLVADLPAEGVLADALGLVTFVTGTLLFRFTNDASFCVFNCARPRSHTPPSRATAKLNARTSRKLFPIRFMAAQRIVRTFQQERGCLVSDRWHWVM